VKKITQNVDEPIFCQNFCLNYGIKYQKSVGYSVISQATAGSKQSPIGGIFAQSGHPDKKPQDVLVEPNF
jgi:hypothetical protein